MLFDDYTVEILILKLDQNQISKFFRESGILITLKQGRHWNEQDHGQPKPGPKPGTRPPESPCIAFPRIQIPMDKGLVDPKKNSESIYL